MKSSWNKGLKQTPEWTEKRRVKLVGNKSRTGQKQSIEERMKKSATLQGRPKSKKHKDKVAAAQRGIPRPSMRFENHPNWRGGRVTRSSKLRLKEHKAGRPRPEICEICGGGGKIVVDLGGGYVMGVTVH